MLCQSGLASHGWHGNSRARHGGVLGLPLRRHRLDLSVKLDALVIKRSAVSVYRSNSGFHGPTLDTQFSFIYLLAVEVGVSPERPSGASEGEHGEGDGDGHVHSNLYKHIYTSKKCYICLV